MDNKSDHNTSAAKRLCPSKTLRLRQASAASLLKVSGASVSDLLQHKGPGLVREGGRNGE